VAPHPLLPDFETPRTETVTPDEAWRAPDLTRDQRMVAFIESIPITKGIFVGRTLELLAYQRDFIRKLYGEGSTVKNAVLSVPRGNGKTGFMAALIVAHLLGPESEPRGEVYAAAIDRNQAGLVFNEVIAILDAVPAWRERVNVQRFKKTVEVLAGDGKGSIFEVLSSDARRGHGLSPTLFIYDEFGSVKTGELYENLVTAQGKRVRSLGIVISTQAANDQHPLSVLIDDGLRGLDPSLYVQLLAAAPDADPFDETVWRAVNPALGSFLSLEDFTSQALRAQRVPAFANTFRNLRLNQRVETDERWLSADVWRACKQDVRLQSLTGTLCYGGLDLGSVRDLTAFALFWPQSGTLAVWTWCPGERLTEREHSDRVPYRAWADRGFIEITPGRAIDKRAIALRLGSIVATFKPRAIAFDRWGLAEFERTLADEGLDLPLKEHGQGFKDMAPSTAAFEARVLNRQLQHDGNPLLAWALSNVVLERDAAGNAKPNKRRSQERVDPVVAAIMAVGLATREPAPKAGPSVYVL